MSLHHAETEKGERLYELDCEIPLQIDRILSK